MDREDSVVASRDQDARPQTEANASAMPSIVWVVMATSGEYSDRSDRSEWPDMAFLDEMRAKDRVAFLTQALREAFDPSDKPEWTYQALDDDPAWEALEAWNVAAEAKMLTATGVAISHYSADTSWFVYEVQIAPEEGSLPAGEPRGDAQRRATPDLPQGDA